jgi:hypothetical protein
LDQSPHVQEAEGTDFKASGSIKWQPQISEDSKVLTCKGMVLGSIDKVAFLGTHIAASTRAEFAHFYFSNIADFIRATFHSSEVTPQLNHGIEVIYQLLFVPKLLVPLVLITSKAFHEHCLSFLSTSPNIRGDAVKHLESTIDIDLVAGTLGDGTLFSTSIIAPGISSAQEQEQTVPTFGLCYSFCEPGDTTAVIYGCTVPVALRSSKKNPGQFEVLGDVYVDGYMHGEAIRQFEEREFELC